MKLNLSYQDYATCILPLESALIRHASVSLTLYGPRYRTSGYISMAGLSLLRKILLSSRTSAWISFDWFAYQFSLELD